MTDSKPIKNVADAYRKMVSEDLVKGSIIAYNHETDKREKTRFQTPNQHTKAFAALPADHTGNEHTANAQKLTAEADKAWKDPARNWGKDDKHDYHVSGEEAQLKAANAHTDAAEKATHPAVKQYHMHMAAYHEGKMEHHTNRRYDNEN